MTTEFWVLLGIVWLAGFLKELTIQSKNWDRIDNPKNIPFWLVGLVLFFTWPYFYFYGKA